MRIRHSPLICILIALDLSLHVYIHTVYDMIKERVCLGRGKERSSKKSKILVGRAPSVLHTQKSLSDVSNARSFGVPVIFKKTRERGVYQDRS